VNPLCPDDGKWSARDEQSSEDEVNEFLGALVRLIKPKFVVETGCYLGDGTLAIANALRANGFGTILTCDIDPTRVAAVDRRIQEQGLENYATVILRNGKELIEACGSQIDFAFIDSSPLGQDRADEINALLPFLSRVQMFALHDTAPQHEQITAVAGYFASRPELSSVYFNTPRGLSLFMKK